MALQPASLAKGEPDEKRGSEALPAPPRPGSRHCCRVSAFLFLPCFRVVPCRHKPFFVFAQSHVLIITCTNAPFSRTPKTEVPPLGPPTLSRSLGGWRQLTLRVWVCLEQRHTYTVTGRPGLWGSKDTQKRALCGNSLINLGFNYTLFGLCSLTSFSSPIRVKGFETEENYRV